MTNNTIAKPTIWIRDVHIINDGRRRGITYTIEISVVPGNEELSADVQRNVVDAIREVSDVVDIRESREVGSVYDGAFIISQLFRTDITIVPYNECLHRDILKAVTKAVEKFGELVDVEDD